MTSAQLVHLDPVASQSITQAGLLSALTFALDLTEGATPGHGLRCCLLGMRVAAAIGLPAEELTPLYYALLLKDIGCSSNASRMTQVVGGDDRAVKGVAKFTDWTSLVRSANPRTLVSLWSHVLPEEPVHKRAARMLSLAANQRRNNRLMIELRCERGRTMVRKLELGEAAAHAIYHLDEHWDGRGYPSCLCGESIPLIARICAIAQNLDIFAAIDGPQAAIDVLRSRSGTWFDPLLVAVVEDLHEAGELWHDALPHHSVEACRELVMRMQPNASLLLADDVDIICAVFAEVVDAKSPFTYQHSRRVAEVTFAIARALYLPVDRQQMLHRCALLHDLGKLGTPNTILDKAAPLTSLEWDLIRQHPLYTRSILERVPAFAELAVLASEHHERLDGSGYPYGLKAHEMTLESKILALADQFGGMTERRPYHPGYDACTALEMIRKLVPTKFDPECFDALELLVASGLSAAQLTADLIFELA